MLTITIGSSNIHILPLITMLLVVFFCQFSPMLNYIQSSSRVLFFLDDIVFEGQQSLFELAYDPKDY
jgi:hypothetical protein